MWLLLSDNYPCKTEMVSNDGQSSLPKKNQKNLNFEFQDDSIWYPQGERAQEHHHNIKFSPLVIYCGLHVVLFSTVSVIIKTGYIFIDKAAQNNIIAFQVLSCNMTVIFDAKLFFSLSAATPVGETIERDIDFLDPINRPHLMLGSSIHEYRWFLSQAIVVSIICDLKIEQSMSYILVVIMDKTNVV